MAEPSPLPLRFFARDVLTVAPALLGQHLCREGVVLRITEVEAYRWPGDTACHARSGRTERNDAIWGPPGRAYVYLCYGIHNMLNVVTGADGEAQAVLVRACEPVEGLAEIERRRGGKQGPVLLAGPGKIGQALGLDLSWCHHALYEPKGLTLYAGTVPSAIAVGPRVGIDYAEPEHVALPWRFADADSRWVTHRKGLAAWEGTVIEI
ncbi:MAG: DNA-3-methyladenine glycosylase [Myxococcota bacterium]